MFKMTTNNRKTIFTLFIPIALLALNTAHIPPIAPAGKTLAQKTKHCQELIKELAQTSGLKSIDIPKVEVVQTLPNQSLAIAMFDDKPPTISVHEWTYDFCMDPNHTMLGKDSLDGLVFILSHELAHVIKKHTDRQLYQKSVDISVNDIERKSAPKNSLDSLIRMYRGLSTRYNIRKNEAEADLYAGFTAYLAGYNTRQAGIKLLESAYKVFELKTERGKYVSLAERKTIVEETGKQLDTLIQVFEMANLLTMAGEYDIATTCYKYINHRYSSPALLNNVGLSIVLETTEFLDTDMVPYFLPFSINTSLVKIKGKDVPVAGDGGDVGFIDLSENPNKVKEIVNDLKLAIGYFKDIQVSNPDDYQSYLNESIANMLIHVFRSQLKNELFSDTEDYKQYAIAAALKAKNAIEFGSPSDKALSDIYMMLSILAHYEGNTEQTNTYYERSKSLNGNNSLVSLNEDVLKGNELPETNTALSSFNSICDTFEMINGNQEFADLFEGISSWDMNLTLVEGSEEKILFQSESFNTGTLFNVSVTKNGVEQKYHTVYQINESYSHNTACNISKQDSMSRLTFTYGKRPQVLQSLNGTFHSYNSRPESDNGSKYTNGIIFYSNNTALVDRWYLFEKMEPE